MADSSKPIRVLMISKACVVGTYQRKLEEIATHPGIELSVVVPPYWDDPRGRLLLERRSAIVGAVEPGAEDSPSRG